MPLRGLMCMTHRKEGRRRKYRWRVWLSVSILCATLRVSRTRHRCVTLKPRWPKGGDRLLCQCSKDCLAISVPSQGQFVVCDLLKGNVTWQELLTSEEHLGVFRDIGHSYSFRIYPFVIFKIDTPSCFPYFNVCFLWRFIWVSTSRLPYTHSLISQLTVVSLPRESKEEEEEEEDGTHQRKLSIQIMRWDAVAASKITITPINHNLALIYSPTHCPSGPKEE